MAVTMFGALSWVHISRPWVHDTCVVWCFRLIVTAQMEVQLSVIPKDPTISQMKVYGDLSELHARLSQVRLWVMPCAPLCPTRL